MNLKVHHIGYLVKNMNKALSCFLKLGYQKITENIYDEYRGIDICFVEKDGYLIELISSVNKESVVKGWLKNIGNSPYHICYLCNDLDTTAEQLKTEGYVQWEAAHEAVALNGKRVAFFVNPHLGMIELLEMK